LAEVIIRQFIRRHNMTRITTRAPCHASRLHAKSLAVKRLTKLILLWNEVLWFFYDSLLMLCYAFNLLMAFDRLLLKGLLTYLLTWTTKHTVRRCQRRHNIPMRRSSLWTAQRLLVEWRCQMERFSRRSQDGTRIQHTATPTIANVITGKMQCIV